VLTVSLVVRKVSLIAISPNVRRLLIKVLEVFEAFQHTAYAPTCKTDCLQILYKFCKNWISVPNIVHQLKLSWRCKYCKIHSRSNFQDAINSIRRLAAERVQAMTSVFYDVIRLESVRGRSNVLIEGHFDGFWGIWTPKMLSAIVWTPKRVVLTSQRVFWTIAREIPCTGYFSRRVRGKIKIKMRGHIFHVFRQALP